MGGFGSGKGIRRNAKISKKLNTDSLPCLVIPAMIKIIKDRPEVKFESKEIKFSMSQSFISIERIGDKIIDTDKIKVIAMPCTYGGFRYFGCCPLCQKRVRTLYLYHTLFACRHCLKMCYISQNNNLSYRLRIKRDKIAEKINGNAYEKPKWMRKRTFSDLRIEFLELEEKVRMADFFSLRNHRSVNKAFSDCPSALLSIEFFGIQNGHIPKATNYLS